MVPGIAVVMRCMYNRKLSRFHEGFGFLYKLFVKYRPVDQAIAMSDIQPIDVCQLQHVKNSKTAQLFVSKGYGATKKYYIGAKLHIITQGRRHKLPFPTEFALASAEIHDIWKLPKKYCHNPKCKA